MLLTGGMTGLDLDFVQGGCICMEGLVQGNRPWLNPLLEDLKWLMLSGEHVSVTEYNKLCV
jgi:hypothetical protein